MNIFAQSLGLVRESDVISLSPDLTIAGALLLDSSTGARHIVRRPARRALQQLESKCMVKSWIVNTEKNGLSTVEALNLLIFLDSIAGLKVYRSVMQNAAVLLLRLKLRLYGMAVSPNAQRLPISWKNLWRAVLQGSMPIVLASIFTSIFVYGINVSIPKYVIFQSMFLLNLILGTVVHEACHWAIATSDKHHGVIVRRGLRIGIIHRPQSLYRDMVSAVTGPVAGCLASLTIACIVYIFTHNLLLAGISICTGMLHFLSWLPSYGDGKVLWNFLKGNYAQA